MRIKTSFILDVGMEKEQKQELGWRARAAQNFQKWCGKPRPYLCISDCWWRRFDIGGVGTYTRTCQRTPRLFPCTPASAPALRRKWYGICRTSRTVYAALGRYLCYPFLHSTTVSHYVLRVHSVQWNAGMGNTDTLHPNSCFCSFSIFVTMVAS